MCGIKPKNMERVKIKKAQPNDEKGCWEQLPGHGKPTVYCPNCGGGLLGGFSSHRFEPNGDVNNSVVCHCGFHEFIHLEDWDLVDR